MSPVRRARQKTKIVDTRALESLVDEMRRNASSSRSPQRVVSGYIARSPIPALVADDSGAYVDANAAALALTGFTRAELMRRTVADLTAPSDAPVEERLWRSFLRSDHQRGTYALRRKDGETIQVDYDAYTAIAPGVHVSFLTRRRGAANLKPKR
jgi:PAS domain S-box-containing protein